MLGRARAWGAMEADAVPDCTPTPRSAAPCGFCPGRLWARKTCATVHASGVRQTAKAAERCGPDPRILRFGRLSFSGMVTF